MRNMILVKGVFGDLNGYSTEGSTQIRFIGSGAGERLDIIFPGQYSVNVPYRPIERFFKQLYEHARQEGYSGKTLEASGTLEGFYSSGTIRNKAGTIMVWIRWNPAFEMLTVAFDNLGQISVPYAPITRLAKQERGSLA